MILKLIEKTVDRGDGTSGTSAAIINAQTGEPLQGVVGYGIICEHGQRVLQVKTTAFVHDKADGIAIASRLPTGNGK